MRGEVFVYLMRLNPTLTDSVALRLRSRVSYLRRVTWRGSDRQLAMPAVRRWLRHVGCSLQIR